ncbi:MAG: zinc ribbon domain-containing protein [Candidatus Odinarchaeota archaeon]
MHLTVKIPLMTDKLSEKKLQQLEKLARRDTTVIKRYLAIIQHEEPNLWRVGKAGQRLDVTKLDELTLTSKPLTRKTKNKDGTATMKTTPGRPVVKHDLKQEFKDKITAREIKECRDTSVAAWQAYCAARTKHGRVYWNIMQKTMYIDCEDEMARVLHWWEHEKQPRPPCQAENYQPAKLPRKANVGTTVFLHERKTKLTNYWLEAYYQEKGKHLWLPLNLSSYHRNQLRQGNPKVAQLIKHDNERWYAHVTIEVKIPAGLRLIDTAIGLPEAVVSLDLGMNKAATAVLLTVNNPRESLTKKNIRFFKQAEKKRAINKLDNIIASLQRKKDLYQTEGRDTKTITRALRERSRERHELAVQLDHELTAKIVDWVIELSHHYTVHVVIGKLTGIRNSRHKGDGKSRKHRRELNRWSFYRISEFLRYKLLRAGLPEARFTTTRESWTSKTCSKCGSTNTSRPYQSLLICHDCGAKLQADVNGAVNIAFKLIFSLDDEVAFDQALIKPLLDQNQTILNESFSSERATGRRITTSSSSISSPSSGNEPVPAVHVTGEPANMNLSSTLPIVLDLDDLSRFS